MELYQLEYLVAIEEYKTVLKASEMLNVSQPSVTKAIQKLEEEFGFPLFDRVKNRLVINEYGLEAVKHARKVLKDTEQLKSATLALYKASQSISIASNAPAPLWGICSLIDSNVNTKLISDNETILQGFIDNEYCLIILDYPIDNLKYVCRKIVEEQLHIAVKPNHALAKYREVTFDDINGYNFLRLSSVGYWNDITDKHLPLSKMLLQENVDDYQILVSSSDLPIFRTNLTIQRYAGKEDRIYIPISDPEAALCFYAIYLKKNRGLFDPILDRAAEINWANYTYHSNQK